MLMMRIMMRIMIMMMMTMVAVIIIRFLLPRIKTLFLSYSIVFLYDVFLTTFNPNKGCFFNARSQLRFPPERCRRVKARGRRTRPEVKGSLEAKLLTFSALGAEHNLNISHNHLVIIKQNTNKITSSMTKRNKHDL